MILRSFRPNFTYTYHNPLSYKYYQICIARLNNQVLVFIKVSAPNRISVNIFLIILCTISISTVSKTFWHTGINKIDRYESFFVNNLFGFLLKDKSPIIILQLRNCLMITVSILNQSYYPYLHTKFLC